MAVPISASRLWDGNLVMILIVRTAKSGRRIDRLDREGLDGCQIAPKPRVRGLILIVACRVTVLESWGVGGSSDPAVG